MAGIPLASNYVLEKSSFYWQLMDGNRQMIHPITCQVTTSIFPLTFLSQRVSCDSWLVLFNRCVSKLALLGKSLNNNSLITLFLSHAEVSNNAY